MEFIYNNTEYIINKYDSISELTSRGDLLRLPLSAWKELFLLKGGYVDKTMLLNVLDRKIDYYDSSKEVNSFIFNETPLWLDKATRVGLVNLVNSSSDNVTLALGNQIITIPVEIAKHFLSELEVYAGKCYVNTARHKIAINDLKTIDELINYDYTTGYPEKLTFNL